MDKISLLKTNPITVKPNVLTRKRPDKMAKKQGKYNQQIGRNNVKKYIIVMIATATGTMGTNTTNIAVKTGPFRILILNDERPTDL